MIRKSLAALYTFCGYASALFLALIAVLTLVQIIARQFGIPMESTELAGFCLAASTFLGLAYTFVNGDHIRVGILSNAGSPGLRRLLEIWCCLVGLATSGYAAFAMTAFTLETFTYGDLSPGMVGMPLWIPQTGLAVGLIVLTIGFLEQLVIVIRGGTPDYVLNAGEGHE